MPSQADITIHDTATDSPNISLDDKRSDIKAVHHDINFDSSFVFENLLMSWQQTLGNIKHNYAKAADNLVDELLATISGEQLNDALYQYVTKNVSFLHDLQIDLHDGWLRLQCTVDILGLYFTVASNFELIHMQLDKYTQRIVLKQISQTDVIELHSRQWYKAPAARLAVSIYRALLRKDPLAFILSSIKIKGVPFTEHKGEIIYLEIGRWLKNSEQIMTMLKKAQVNYGELHQDQLLLKVQLNFGEILSLGDPDADIITEKDNPNRKDK